MKNLQALTDKTAIGLSVLCTLHCLVLPSLLVLLPGAAALSLNNESLHLWMVLAVIPTSAYALTLGCKQHKKYHVISIGVAGLAFLILAVVLGESLGETWEKTLTVVGAVIITTGHIKNYRLCQSQTDCECPGKNVETFNEPSI